MVQILHRGAGTTKEKTLTFIEGWTNRQIAEYLSGQGFGTIQDFLSIVEKKSGWWDNYEVLFSRPKDRDLEGYLFPDTYRVYGDSAISDIIKKMLANLENKLTANLRLEIKSQDKTIHEILTLASILEKEVSTDYDRAMVADIFYKRIGVGMPLQADSTVNYVSGKSESRAAGIDLNIDNPYNTYKYNNLPPGPICNPGLSSIKAAVYPLKNNYWYFLTTPDGKVIYSETFEQHVAAKNKYY